MSHPTVEELLEELQDLLAGIPPEARPVVIKMAMEQVLHRCEQLIPLAPTGAVKEQIEMAMRDLQAQLAAFKRESPEDPPK
jgi:DNA-directed RNA polymerase specialized sigma24 family protein